MLLFLNTHKEVNSMLNNLINRKLESKGLSQAKKREYIGTISGVTGIVCNILLCLIKFIIGTVTHSVSITADAVNNLSDAGSSIITIAGAKLSNKPVDKEHPFGHGRIEYISALIVAFLILLMGIELGKSSAEKIIHPEDIQFNIWYIVILAAAIFIKFAMAIFNKGLFKISGNINMKAVAQDSLNDCIATIATIIALIISSQTEFKIADGIIGIVVAVFVLISGIEIIKDIIGDLLGKAPDAELVKSIEEIMLYEECIVGVHDLIVHDYGPGRIIASAHAEVPCNIDVLRLHDIIDNVEKRINKKLNIMICIHMDPIVVDDDRINSYKNMMEKIIKQYDNTFSFHDFRVVEGQSHTNFIFDLVIPHGYKKDSKTILKELREITSQTYPDIMLVVTIEHSFV